MQVMCETLTKVMQDTHGESAVLDIAVARKLEHMKHVRIIGVLNHSTKKKAVELKNKFDNGGKTRIAWVQDYAKDGGAELSNQLVVKVGRDLGFDIVVVTPETFNGQVIDDCELCILNNVFEFRDSDFNFIMDRLYSKNVPFVKYEHDHREITERKVKSQRMFDSAAMCVFISPLQMRNHVNAFGPALNDRSVVLPLAIDTDKFTLLDELRIGNSVLVPSMEKCRDNVTKYIIAHSEFTYTIVGYADFPALDNVSVVNSATIEQMPVLYNKHEFVLHLPQKVGGGERVVFEAVLCGCKVITNENSAHTTWDEHFNWKERATLEEQLRAAPYAFWRKVAICARKR